MQNWKRRTTILDVPSKIRDWTLERLGWEDWESLLKEGKEFAKEQIRSRRWRGGTSRVLPEGYDAESLATAVAGKMLRGECSLALGWTRERLVREMERLIGNEVRRLNALKEASRMRSEWDVLSVGEDGKAQSIFPWMTGTIADPHEEAVEHEEDAVREKAESRMRLCLYKDEVARGVFDCLCRGMRKRGEIAAKLGVSVGAVTAARKRIERKLEEFHLMKALEEEAENAGGRVESVKTAKGLNNGARNNQSLRNYDEANY